MIDWQEFWRMYVNYIVLFGSALVAVFLVRAVLWLAWRAFKRLTRRRDATLPW
jgi:hypothetical protein